MSPFAPKETPTEFYTPKNFFTLSGAAAGVWFFCLVIGAILPANSLSPFLYRIIAVILSEIIAIVMVARSDDKKPVYWFLAIFNGLLIFVNASGWNVVTSNTFFSDKTLKIDSGKIISKAGLFDFHQIQWWENNNLYLSHTRLLKSNDSLKRVVSMYQNKIGELGNMGGMDNQIAYQREVDSLKKEIGVKDSMILEIIGSKSTPQLTSSTAKSGASIFLEKMNVLYVDVENPVLLSVGGNVDKSTITLGNAVVSKIGPGRYSIRPSKIGTDFITVNHDGITSKFEVRVKRFPDPVATVGGINGGIVSGAAFKSQGGLFAGLKDSEFDYPFAVLSYKVGARNPLGVYQEVAVDGSRWTAAESLILSQPPGAFVYFDNIKVMGPGNKARNVEGVVFQLR